MIIDIVKGVVIYSQINTENPDEYSKLGLTKEEVDSAARHQVLEDTLNYRRNAYRLESDPLYMEWQYDQTPESEAAWRAKVAEIKARYPLPSN